jgi:hypothetical protein
MSTRVPTMLHVRPEIRAALEAEAGKNMPISRVGEILLTEALEARNRALSTPAQESSQPQAGRTRRAALRPSGQLRPSPTEAR